MKTSVFILTGYLGSGKTTLLEKLLLHVKQQDKSTVVMMNEMGDEDIDGEQIQGLGFPVKKLLDGCICCSIRGELTEGLREVIVNFNPDHIIIETTGVADPIDVIDGIIDPELYDKLDVKGIISVVDVSRYLDLTSRFQSASSLINTIRNQIKYADIILLNKVDLVPKDKLEKVKSKIVKENATAPIFSTIKSDFDLSELFTLTKLSHQAVKNEKATIPTKSTLQKSIGRFSLRNKSQRSLYNSIDSFSYQFTRPVNPKRFEAFLKSLPQSVYRAKGYVLFENESNIISFQQTENQVILMPVNDFEPRKRVAVFIGERLDQEKLICDIDKCYV